ncbi:MAG: hypothetical protein ACJ77B_02310 [Chloroflexota bacterium]
MSTNNRRNRSTARLAAAALGCVALLALAIGPALGTGGNGTTFTSRAATLLARQSMLRAETVDADADELDELDNMLDNDNDADELDNNPDADEVDEANDDDTGEAEDAEEAPKVQKPKPTHHVESKPVTKHVEADDEDEHEDADNGDHDEHHDGDRDGEHEGGEGEHDD